MHYLVTGGSGFIGSALCAALLRDGHAVSVLSRSVEATRRTLPDGVRVIDDLAALEGVDAVVNLAGENLGAHRWNAQRKQAFRDSRLGITRRLVDWMSALAQRPAVLVSGSAIGYYGAHGDEAITEDAAPGDDFSAQMCRDWEAQAARAEALGVRVCSLRTGIVLAPGGGALVQMLPAFKLGGGGPMGDGRQWMSWVHRDDLIALIRWLVDTPAARGAYNGTAPEPVRNAEFAKTLGHALHRPAILPMPAFALKLIVGEMAQILLSGQRVLPARAMDQGFTFRFASLTPALADVLAKH